MKNTLRFYELYESYSLPTYAKHFRITHIFMVTFYCDTFLFSHIFYVEAINNREKKHIEATKHFSHTSTRSFYI